jgi:diaminopimelate epimerase
MGAAVLEPAKVPFKAGDYPVPIKGHPLRTQQGVLHVTVTSMGNPHCSVFVADFGSLDWASLGREIETNPLFPNRTNVEFVRVVSRSEIEVRFWERGVGHTMSSGTGSCAAAVASILNGLTDRQVRVRTEAGSLQVDWPENGEVFLTGPVERIAQGIYNLRGKL